MVKQKEVSPKLGRQDWVEAGLVVLAQSGVEAVRVEPLAKLLKVTKGSFYWHFKNRDALLDAILEEWVRLDTYNIIERVESLNKENAMIKLLRLFEIAIEDDGKNDGRSDGRLENAIRAWAANDERAATVLTQVDQQRLDYTRNLFLQIGFSPSEALVRARIVYYALVGEFTIGLSRTQAERLAEIRMQHAILTRQ
jgi:AcrR family transcriptional regulator